MKESIAAIIFDFDYLGDDIRPSEQACHMLSESIMNRLGIKLEAHHNES
jgi:hypothetical protein